MVSATTAAATARRPAPAIPRLTLTYCTRSPASANAAIPSVTSNAVASTSENVAAAVSPEAGPAGTPPVRVTNESRAIAKLPAAPATRSFDGWARDDHGCPCKLEPRRDSEEQTVAPPFPPVLAQHGEMNYGGTRR